MSQGTVQNTDNLYVKDAAVFYAEYDASFTTAAQVTGASWTEIGSLTSAEKTSDRAAEAPPAMNVEHPHVVTLEEVTIALAVQELGATALNVLMKGITQIENIAGTPVAGATHALTAGNWGYNDPILVENQNGDLTQLTINTVTGSTDGLLVADTDYFIGVDQTGATIITVVDSVTVTTESQTMTIDYDYTPNATTRLWETEAEVLGEYMLKFEATMTDGRAVKTYYPRCTYAGGGEIADKDKDSAEFKDMSISIKAKLHPAVVRNGKKALKFTDFIAA